MAVVLSLDGTGEFGQRRGSGDGEVMISIGVGVLSVVDFATDEAQLAKPSGQR